jgi:hypothetical protein
VGIGAAVGLSVGVDDNVALGPAVGLGLGLGEGEGEGDAGLPAQPAMAITRTDPANSRALRLRTL